MDCLRAVMGCRGEEGEWGWGGGHVGVGRYCMSSFGQLMAKPNLASKVTADAMLSCDLPFFQWSLI